jgi:hypothetical protein
MSGGRRRRRGRPGHRHQFRIDRPGHQLLDEQLDERNDQSASGQHDDFAELHQLDLVLHEHLDALDEHDRLDRNDLDLRHQHEHPELLVLHDDPEFEQLQHLHGAELQQLLDQHRHVDHDSAGLLEHPRCTQRPELMPR